MRAQGALEYLIIIAAVLGISAVVVLFVGGAFIGSSGGADLSKCRLAAANCKKDMAMGLSATCPTCDIACKDASGKDLLSGTPGCGTACEQCKLGVTVGAGSGQTIGAKGYWSMDDSKGIIVSDGSGNGNTGTYVGETFNDGTLTNNPQRTIGKYGSGLKFNGANTYVAVADSPSLRSNDFTIMAWFNATTTSGVILGKEFGTITDDSRVIWFEGANKLSAHTSTIGAAYDGYVTVTGIQTNQWYHVAFVKEGTTTRFYIDGSLVMTGSTASATVNYDSSLLFIGADDNDNNEIGDEVFNGVIDSVRIFNRALTAVEIQAENSSSRSVVRPVGAWEFEEGATQFANDTHIWVAGSKGTALSFDGVDDYVNVGNNANLQITNQITISAWVKISTANTYIVVDKFASSNPNANKGYSLTIFNGNIRFSTGNGISDDYDDTVSIADGNWHHAAVTYNGTHKAIYRDGNRVQIKAWTADIIDCGKALQIGKRSDLATYLLNGAVDEVRVFNRALSETEIRGL